MKVLWKILLWVFAIIGVLGICFYFFNTDVNDDVNYLFLNTQENLFDKNWVNDYINDANFHTITWNTANIELVPFVNMIKLNNDITETQLLKVIVNSWYVHTNSFTNINNSYNPFGIKNDIRLINTQDYCFQKDNFVYEWNSVCKIPTDCFYLTNLDIVYPLDCPTIVMPNFNGGDTYLDLVWDWEISIIKESLI